MGEQASNDEVCGRKVGELSRCLREPCHPGPCSPYIEVQVMLPSENVEAGYSVSALAGSHAGYTPSQYAWLPLFEGDD